MQFATQDLTVQYISNSYQNIVQRYIDGSMEYFLDGLGNVVLIVPTASIGFAVITSDVTSSMAVSSSVYAVYTDSCSFAYNALTADFAIDSEYAVTASYLNGSLSVTSASYSNTASYAVTASYVSGSSSSTISASYARRADTASYFNGTSSWASNSISASYADRAFSASWAPMPTISNSSSWASSSISASYADRAFSASWAPMPTVSNSSSWASQSLSSSFTGTASYSISSSNAIFSDGAGIAVSSIYSDSASIAIGSTYSDTASLSIQSDSASYLIPGATFYQVSGSNGVPASYIEPYDYSPETAIYQPPYKAGRIFWDNRYNDWAWYATTGSGATSWRSHFGKEVSFGVHNPYSVTLPRLSVVYFGTSSIAGTYYPDVYLAQSDGTGQHTNVAGVIRNDIPSGSTGFMLQLGVMHRTNMGPFQVGDKLWLSPVTPGGLTNIEPGQPNEQVQVGWCSEAGVLGSFICDRYTVPIPPNAYAGITSDIVIKNNNDGTITVSTGSINLYPDSTGVGIIQQFKLPQTILSLVTGSGTNFITATHSGSMAVQYQLSTNAYFVNDIDVIPIALIDINYEGIGNWDLHILNVNASGLALSNKAAQRDVRLYGYQRQDGLTLFTSGSSGNFGITAGSVWFGPSIHHLSQYISNTASCDTYHWVNTNSTWSYHTQSVYNNGYYNDVGGLVALGPNSWSVNFVYRIITDDVSSSDVALVLSNEQYDTVVTAINTTQPPTDLPSQIVDLGILTGFIAVQSGSFTNTNVQSAYSILFAPATVTQHNSLLGLQGGQGGEYYHFTKTEHDGTGTGVLMYNNKPIFAGATPGHIPYWKIDQTLTLTGSVQVYNDQYVLINSGSPDSVNPEALLVFQKNSASVNTLGAYAVVDGFSQIYNQNFSSGSNASTDIVATSDIGDQNANYIDMGINSSQYNVSDDPTQPLDGYITMDGGDLWLLTSTDNKIKFAFNNTASTNYFDKTGFYLSGSLYGTTSISIKSNTASFSDSSSYVFGSNVYGQVSGSKTAETASYIYTIIYSLSNYDITGSITYVGEISTTTTDWRISKMNTALFTSSMVSGTSNYATNWTNRYSLIYV